jgi:dTDP-4-dehydrorhamnose reductase
MRVLVFGETGQVARELNRRVPSDVELTAYGRDVVDLELPGDCTEIVMGAEVDAIINAAAYTGVDAAEAEPKLAMTVNAAAPAVMAKAAAARGIPFLHLSSDYVFPGHGDRPWKPDDETRPINAYGRSKAEGELGVRLASRRHLILRTSWVVSAHGSNFVKTMLRLGATRKSLNVVADQVGGPTPAAAIADALYVCARAMAGGQAGGIHHFAGAPDVSWAEFAREILAGTGCAVQDIPSSEYPTPAARPMNSRLDCTSLERDFGIARPDWRAGLADILKELA